MFSFKITANSKILWQFLLSINQKRGVDDKDLLPYFPYRDDGEKILEVIENIVKDYVDLWVWMVLEGDHQPGIEMGIV